MVNFCFTRPLENAVISVKDVTLQEGSNLLLLEPVYGGTAAKQKPVYYGLTNFTEGLKAYLNGRPL